ncbi:MAG: FecR domain-containing protein [Odoribacter splanchnicus]
MSPDEQALVDKQEGQIRVRKVVAEEYIGWTRGEFRFTRTRLEEVMTRLARWYDVEVFFCSSGLEECPFYSEFGTL